MTDSFDPHRDDVLDDPFRWYAWLRAGPRAYHVERSDYFAVSRYEDVVAVTKNHAVFSSTGGVGPLWQPRPIMSMYDPPDHSRLRRLVARGFTPKTVQTLRPAMALETDRLLAAASGSDFDFVTAVAEPLVAVLIADLLGLPRELVPRFRRWSLSITGILAGNLDAAAGEEDRRELVRCMKEARGGGEGLLQTLSDASAAERLSEKELTAFCVLLLVAGFETTVNGMSNLVHALFRHPDVLEPGTDAPSTACVVEEALRYDPPVHAFFRNTLAPYTFPDGSTIPTGKKVMVLFASANHDAQQFASPEVFDPRRPGLDAHVAFGNGVHHCIGAPLARALYGTLLDALVARGSRLVERPAARRTRNSMLRGFESLPVAWAR